MTITDPPYESLERHRAKGTTTRLKESKSSSNKWFKTIPNKELYFLLQALYTSHRHDSHCYIFCDSETEHVILSGRSPYDKKADADLVDIACKADPALLRWSPPADCGWKAWPSLTWVKTKLSSLEENPEYITDDDIRMGMGYHWRRCDERILFLEKGKRKLLESSLKNVLLGPRAGPKDYPTAKPYDVLRALLLNSGEPGGILLDPFAGSGSVALVAKEVAQMRSVLIDTDISWIVENVASQFPKESVHIFREKDCRC